jgi:predicted O-linked N-acetylglucosamine transferase (SPINDLY family)
MENNLDKNIFSIAVENFKKKEFFKAKEYFEKALKIHPENVSILENLALTNYNLKNLSDCKLQLKKILGLDKNSKKIYNFLLKVLREEDNVKELKKYTKEGLEKNIVDKKFSIINNIVFPFINEDKGEIKDYRDQTNKYLDDFLNSDKNIELNIDKQSIDPPIFNYSYDEFDNLELNKKFVKLFKKIYPQLNIEIKLNEKNTDKIKIGFISEYFSNHTIGKLFRGTIFELDQNKFEIYIFHTNKTKKGKIFSDFLAREINSNLKNIILPNSFEEKVETIKNKKLDVVFYPDIGMSSDLYFLTFLRFAKYQITSWGHPISTGNPNIDFFISSSKSEVKNAQIHYSEKVIFLDHMLYYYKPETSLLLNLDSMNNQNIYSCPQTLFKIHPDFDQILKQILIKDKKAKIYFIKDNNKTLFEKLITRFKKTIGSDLDRIIFNETMSVEKYINHCGSSSVLLDPIFYGGGNSFYESMIYGTPTVTLPTNYLKNRLTLGAYNQMEVEDAPIVNSPEQYVDKAIEIANLEPKKLLETKARYKDAAFNKLFENRKYINELEEFLTNLF